MERPNYINKQFAINLMLWGFFGLMAAIGLCTTMYWLLWLARDLHLIE
jgi:cell division protein FtsX